jgi:hypothetical protein
VDLEIYEGLIRRSLEHGVPPEIVAAVFEIPADIAKEMQREVRVAKFGTADRAEYLEHLEWTALERVGKTIEHGSPAEVARVTTAVFGRQIAAAGKRPSDALTDARKDLMAAFAGMRDGPAQVMGPGRFVLGGAESDRDDDPDED